MKVKKRDGRVVEFNKDKIISAVSKAYKEVDGDINDDTLAHIQLMAEDIGKTKKDTLSVEDIQDIVEKKLMQSLSLLLTLLHQ